MLEYDVCCNMASACFIDYSVLIPLIPNNTAILFTMKTLAINKQSNKSQGKFHTSVLPIAHFIAKAQNTVAT